MKKLLLALFLAPCFCWSQAITISPATGSTLVYDTAGCVHVSLTSNIGGISGYFWFAAYSGNPMYTPNSGIAFTITPGYPLPITQCNVPPVGTVAQSVFNWISTSPAGYNGFAVYNNPSPIATSSGTITTVTAPSEPDDYNPNQLTQMVRRVRLSDGSFVEVPRADLLSIGNLSYTFSDSGEYSYTFDNSQVATVQLGPWQPPDYNVLGHGEPKGWIKGLSTWAALDGPERNQAAVYSVTSSYLPGLVPMYFQSDFLGIVAAQNGGPPLKPLRMTRHTADNVKIADAAIPRNNGLRRFVIGPAFRPGVKRADVLSEVQTWVKDYGFSFLAPLLSGGSLGSLSPSNQLETDIVTCLRGLNVF